MYVRYVPSTHPVCSKRKGETRLRLAAAAGAQKGDLALMLLHLIWTDTNNILLILYNGSYQNPKRLATIMFCDKCCSQFNHHAVRQTIKGWHGRIYISPYLCAIVVRYIYIYVLTQNLDLKHIAEILILS